MSDRNLPVPVSVPAYPVPPPDDRPSLLEQVAQTRVGRFATALGCLGAAVVFGLPLELGLAGTLFALMVQRRFSTRLLARYFAEGRYARYLRLVEQLEAGAWTARARALLALHRVTGLVMLGRIDEARQVLARLEDPALPARVRRLVALQVATLHLRLFQPDRALAILSQLDQVPTTVPERQMVSLLRACAHLQREEAPLVAQHLAVVESLGPTPDLVPVIQAYRARLAVWAGRASDGVALSREAVEGAGDQKGLLPGLLITHALALSEAGAPETDVLEVLTPVIGHTAELGLASQAEYHYLMARGYLACAMPADARPHLERLGELPVGQWLATRVNGLQVQAIRPRSAQ